MSKGAEGPNAESGIAVDSSRVAGDGLTRNPAATRLEAILDCGLGDCGSGASTCRPVSSGAQAGVCAGAACLTGGGVGICISLAFISSRRGSRARDCAPSSNAPPPLRNSDAVHILTSCLRSFDRFLAFPPLRRPPAPGADCAGCSTSSLVGVVGSDRWIHELSTHEYRTSGARFLPRANDAALYLSNRSLSKMPYATSGRKASRH